MTTIAAAARAFRLRVLMAREPRTVHPRCAICEWRWLRVEAASVGYDAAVAETLSGRHPRGQLAREVPL